MIQATKTEVYSDSGKFVHRLGTESYFKRSMLLPGDTTDKFEEVDEIPEIEDNYIPINEQLLRATKLKMKTETKRKQMFIGSLTCYQTTCLIYQSTLEQDLEKSENRV